MTSPRFAAAALLALAGCSAETAPPQSMPPPEPENVDCGAGALGGYIGHKATDEVLARIREWRRDKPIRVLKPGSIMTMDYRPERLNIFLDDKGIITEFKCN